MAQITADLVENRYWADTITVPLVQGHKYSLIINWLTDAYSTEDSGFIYREGGGSSVGSWITEGEPFIAPETGVFWLAMYRNYGADYTADFSEQETTGLAQITSLINHVRFQTDDIIAPFLFSDDAITDYLKEAEIEACRRQSLLIDTTKIDVISDDYVIDLPLNLVAITRVKVKSQKNSLYQTTIRELDIYNVGWENQTPSEPTYYFTDQQTAKLSVYPKFSHDDELQITASRTPKTLLEINERYHLALCDWVLFRLYSKKDSKIYDSIKSENFLASFIGNFGTRGNPESEVLIQKGAMQKYEFGQVSKPIPPK